MIKTFEDVHPDLYSQIPKDTFYSHVRKLKDNLPREIKIGNFYKDIAILAAEVKDGHTTAEFSSLVNTGILFFKKIFPYKIKILDDKVFVAKNYSYKENIEIGSEIIKINCIAVNKVIEDASRILSYENIPFRNYLLGNPFCLSMWNNYKDFEIIFKEKSTGKIKSITASGGLYAKINFQKEIMKRFPMKYLKSNFNVIKEYYLVLNSEELNYYAQDMTLLH